MKKLTTTIMRNAAVFAAMAFAVVGFTPLATPAYAAAASDCPTNSIRKGADCAKGDEQTGNLFGDGGIFKTITNVLLFLVGAIAVIMLIIGGVRYTISGGDKGQVESAKNTIMYAIIGIVVVILAYAVVNFVIDSLLGAGS